MISCDILSQCSAKVSSCNCCCLYNFHVYIKRSKALQKSHSFAQKVLWERRCFVFCPFACDVLSEADKFSFIFRMDKTSSLWT